MKNRELFLKIFDVPRETINKFDCYHELILKAQQHFNIIGRGTLEEIWLRHFGDSAKVVQIIKNCYPDTRQRLIKVCDIGSGAGFPGIVVALMLKNSSQKYDITLIESNKKKCLFLNTAKEALNLNTEVVNQRAEQVNIKYDVILSRAVTSLKRLVPIAHKLKKKTGIVILHKGKTWNDELNEIKNSWKFNYNIVKNNTLLDKSGGVTIIIKDLEEK